MTTTENSRADALTPCVHADDPKSCYRVRCQLGGKCIDDDMSPRQPAAAAVACPQCGGSLTTWKCTCDPIWEDYNTPIDPQDVLQDTGNPEADRLIGRLTSADPDFNDCTDAAVFIRRIVAEHRGPDGFVTWKEAAIAERQKRVEIENRAPSPADERAAKLYHGRTTAELKEICSTRPAHYPEAHHEFDKTILALIDEIERLQARAASASRTDAVIEALKQAGLFLTNYEPETICTVVQSLLKRAASANETGAEGAKRGTPEQIQAERKLTCEAIDGAMAFGYQNTNPPPSADHWLAPYWHIGRKQAELESRARAMAEDAAPPSGYAYRYSHHGGAVIRFNNGGEVNGSRPIEAVPYWFAAPPPAQADARVGHKSEGE